MKKVILLITLVLIAACVCSCGCNNTKKAKASSLHKNEYVFGQDYQYMYNNDEIIEDSVSWLQKGVNGYYCRIDNFLYFIDPKTKKMTPVCSKKKCKHSSIDCNACVGCINFQYYDGYIYYIDIPSDNDNSCYYLKKFNIKTQKQEVVTYIRYDYPEYWIIHRGYIYYTDSMSSYDGATVTQLAKLYRIDITHKNSAAQQVSNLKKLNLRSVSVSDVQAYGDYIYYDSITVKPNTDIMDPDNKTLTKKKFYYNLSTKKTACITDKLKGKDIEYCGYYNGKIIYSSENNCIYSCNLDGSNSKTLFKYNHKYNFYRKYTDGKYIYFDYINKDKEYYYVYSLEGRCFNKAKMPFKIKSTATFDSDYIICYNEENTALEIIDKSNIATKSKIKAKALMYFPSLT